MILGQTIIGETPVGDIGSGESTPPAEGGIFDVPEISFHATILPVGIAGDWLEDYPPALTISAALGAPIFVGILAPTRLLPSWESNGITASFDIADLTGTSAAEAHETTGDIREIAQSLLLRAEAYINSLPSLEVSNMSAVLTPDHVFDTAQFGVVLKNAFTFQFSFVYSTADVAEE